MKDVQSEISEDSKKGTKLQTSILIKKGEETSVREIPNLHSKKNF